MTIQTDDRPSTEERVSRLEGAYDHLATKADVADVRTEIAEVRIEVADVRTEVVKLRAEMAAMETRMVKWLVSAVGIGVAITVALNRLLG